MTDGRKATLKADAPLRPEQSYLKRQAEVTQQDHEEFSQYLQEKASRDQLMVALRAAGYAVESIEPDTRVSAEVNGLLFATMHRAKGLEFQNVIVTSTTVRQGTRGDVAPQLIYVALTRAKQRAALLTAI